MKLRMGEGKEVKAFKELSDGFEPSLLTQLCTALASTYQSSVMPILLTQFLF